MDHPYYTATVTSARGWSLSAVEGVPPDADEPVILTDPLTYSWSFQNGMIPGQLDPFAASFSLAARTADDVPEIQVGDVVILAVQVGTDGPQIIAPPPMRVVDAEVTLLSKHSMYPARATVQLTDLSVDWSALVPGHVVGYPTSSQSPRKFWRERMAEIGYLIGYSIGCPTWWADDEGPLLPNAGNPGFIDRFFGADAPAYGDNAAAELEGYINSHQPYGLTHSFATVVGASHPAGFEYVGPATWWDPVEDTDPSYDPSLPDAGSWVRIEAVPAARKTDSADLPLSFAIEDGILTLVPADIDPGVAMSVLGINAAWCSIPAKVRRARESSINRVGITGKQDPNDGPEGEAISDQVYYVTDAADVAARGPSTREVPTKLFLGVKDSYVSQEVPYVGANFLNDESTRATGWTFDSFQLTASEIPADLAEWLLPRIAPRLPGEVDGDGILVRHMTLYGLRDVLRFAGLPVTAFITGGQLTITRGELMWSLSTVPGLPIRTGTPPAPITLGSLVAAFPGQTLGAIDPSTTTFADLVYAGDPA